MRHTKQLTLDDIDVRTFLQKAAKLYANLPFHNFSHGLHTAEVAYSITTLARSTYPEAQPLIAWLAGLFHDAGYYLNHSARGHQSQEALSAELAASELQAAGLDAFVSPVKAAILATTHNAEPETVEAKAVRAADMSTALASYPAFLFDNVRLWREFHLLGKPERTWQEQVAINQKIIEGYLAGDIRLTEHYYDTQGQSEWHTRVRINLQKLAKQPEPTEMYELVSTLHPRLEL